MQEQFVTYEIASELKELGFNKYCFRYWNTTPFVREPSLYGNDLDGYSNPMRGKLIAAPLWQQAIDWIRERYKINIIFTQSNHNGCWIYTLEGIDDGKDYYDLYRSYEVVREQAILKVIELCKK